MDLPTDPNLQWPPSPYDTVQKKIQEYAAWYGGDPELLTGQYRSSTANRIIRPSQLSGGVVGFIARMFWGTPPTSGATNVSKLHIPIAEEISAEGGYQLFKNPPRLEVNDTQYQDRINDHIDKGLFAQLVEAAEVASALTGVFIRVGYDLDVSPDALLSIIHPDAAIPSFSHTFLREVIFWRTLSDESGKVLRHLEYHGPKVIRHALYEGDRSTIGKSVELTKHPETMRLQSEIDTGLPFLDVVYVPNLKTRIWRDIGQINNLGRSDFGSVLTLMDALDETYTSWMRDIRLGKARIIVPQDYLEEPTRGQGAIFDTDREVFVGLNIVGGNEDKMQIHPEQFSIRNESHAATAIALVERIISGSGYSAQTFGLSPDVAMTATESESRDKRTYDTRAAKISAWRRALPELTTIILATDAKLGTVKSISIPLNIALEFPPPVRESVKTVSETAKTLRDAHAASTLILVRMVHPDWDDERVNEEVRLIDGVTPIIAP
ncbi:MAG: phage portal protein [Acidobacteria bacterium]|nr:phage portal protein [Acidobacteriota bacterium]